MPTKKKVSRRSKTPTARKRTKVKPKAAAVRAAAPAVPTVPTVGGEESVLYRLIRNGPVSLRELCDKLGKSPKQVEELIERTRAAGVSVHLDSDHIGLSAHIPDYRGVQDTGIEPVLGKRRKVGVISDTHLGSRYCLRAQLRDFIQNAYDEGVRQILHPGDVLEGCYRHAAFELSHVGLQDQTHDLYEVLPKLPGLTYHMITGNHDYTFTDKVGIDVGQYICNYFKSRGRNDLFSYGDRSAFLRLGGAVIELWHPTGYIGYAKSYRLQRRIDSYPSGAKPNILLVGHYHTYAYVQERGVHGFLCPTFQGGQSPFGKSLGSTPSIGGLTLEWSVTKQGTVRDLTVSRRTYYEREVLWTVGGDDQRDGIEIVDPPTRGNFAERLGRLE